MYVILPQKKKPPRTGYIQYSKFQSKKKKNKNTQNFKKQF